MLDRIDDIDWRRLGHAYGSAGDVPDQLRALCSPDQTEREGAFGDLYSNIFHQGSRYEASAYAVPFLLDMVADPATPDRELVLYLLTCLAMGYDESWLPDGFPVAEYRRVSEGGRELLAAKPPSSEENDDPEALYLRALDTDDQNRLYAYYELATYDAVRAGVPMLRTLLAHPDPGLRAGAAYALAWFPEEAAGSLPALREAVSMALAADDRTTAPATDGPGAGGPTTDGAAADESATDGPPADGSAADGSAGGATAGQPAGVREADVAATALVAAGLLGSAPDAALVTDPRPVVRWAAAVARARVLGPDADDATVEELLGWTTAAPRGRRRSAEDVPVPFLNGDLAGYAALALRQVGPRHADRAFDALLDRLPAVEGVEALPVATEALRLAFPDGPLAAGTPPEALTGRQRRLAEVLATSPLPWSVDGHRFVNFSLLLDEYGLPRSHDEMVAYLR
ncbi:HEAT repeat domain-containing protein [Micromonospora echinospora]|uniref:HEAT repeat domain-containing protein n=1 Tax=Micromonospora echinospora TaxID=1877 RepID=UPI0037A7F0F6